MERDQLRLTLLDILEQETWERPEHFTDDTQLREELKLDSVDMVSVLLRLESQLGIGLDSRELETVITVGNLLDILQAKLATPSQRKAA
jgi:acyl carrier protein